MSNSSAAIRKEDVESIAIQINVNYYASLVAFVILYYDYFLTFGEEFRFFWGRKFNSVTVLFFMNRYISIFGNIPVVLQSFRNWSDEGCDNLQKYHQFFSVTVQVVVGAILILRTYALYERNLKIALIMAFFALVVIGIGIWAILGKTPTVEEPFDLSFMLGCHPLISNQEGIRLSVAWGGMLLFDSVIFTLTLFKAIAIWKLGTRRLFHVLVRDGTIYYLVLAMANLSNILTFVLGEPILRGVSTTFANAISVTMVSRLMLNLQNPHLFEAYRHSRTRTHSTWTETDVGPFVTTVVDRDGTTTINESRFVTAGRGPANSTLSDPSSGAGTASRTSKSGSSRDGRWDFENFGNGELYEGRPARALWYDPAWVSGSAIVSRDDDMRRELRAGRRESHRQVVPEEVELSPTLVARGPVQIVH